MKITNTTKSDLGLDAETVVPAGGSIEISNEALSEAKKSPVVKAWFVEKKLTEAGEVKASKPKQERKTDSAKADK